MEHTTRKLNMDEKRKLEKLLLSDIDAANAVYESERTAAREKLKQYDQAHPPTKAVALAVRHQRLSKEQSQIARELAAMGYSINSNSRDYSLYVSYGDLTKSLKEFDASTAKTKSALAELKRTYTLKLFAGGAEAQELFALLASELKTIITR